jgi:hypothetical protein
VVSKAGLGGKPGEKYQESQSKSLRALEATGSEAKKERRQVLNSVASRERFLNVVKY